MNVLSQLGINNVKSKNKTKKIIDMFELGIVSSSSERSQSQQPQQQQSEHREEERLIVFTDGACLGNGKKYAKAGYAVVWPYHSKYNIGKRLIGPEQTNNRAEFSALIEAQQIADRIDPTHQKPLYVYTDSQLLINSITKWMPDWKKNNWKKADKKPVLNQDLLKKIDDNQRPLIFKHVRAHTGKKDWESIFNHEVDRLARDAAMK